MVSMMYFILPGVSFVTFYGFLLISSRPNGDGSAPVNNRQKDTSKVLTRPGKSYEIIHLKKILEFCDLG